MEAQLAHQSQILDQIHESVLTMDQMGYITSWNRGAERLFGYTSFEAVGRNILFLYADEDLGDEEGGALPDLFAEHGGRMMEVKRRKKSGDIFWASLSLSPLRDLAGRPNGLIAYLTDITERKQAEEQLHHLAYYDELTGLPHAVRAPGRPGPDGGTAQRDGRLHPVHRPEPLQARQ
jgi:PAS domain S-box-containing protein